MTRSSLVLARRYGQALFDAAEDLKADKAELRRLLTVASEVLNVEPGLMPVLENPATPSETREALLSTLFGGVSEDHVVRKLTTLLARRGRLALLGDIEKSYTRIWHARAHIVDAEAVVAATLSSGQVEALRQGLEKASGRQVELTTRVEPGLVGGIMLKVGGRVFDGSVRARLRALRASLAQTATAH